MAEDRTSPDVEPPQNARGEEREEPHLVSVPPGVVPPTAQSGQTQPPENSDGESPRAGEMDQADATSPSTVPEFAGDVEPTLRRARDVDDTQPTVPPLDAPVERRRALPLLLFILTFLAMVWAHLTPVQPANYWSELVARVSDASHLTSALQFAGALMAILLAQVLGRYVAARASGIDTYAPYFIPAPTILGTLGSVTRVRTPPPDRSALLRLGVAGPLFGMAMALPISAWGLANSQPIGLADVDPTRPFAFGSSILFGWLRLRYAPDAAGLELHPLAFAGWVGLLVLSINLTPAAQLDGGHVTYALFGRTQRRISAAFIVGLFTTGLILGLSGPPGHPNWGGAVWIFWALLLFVVGLEHPPVRNPERPLSWAQRALGWLTVAILVVTFVPVPVTTLPGPAEAHPTIEQPAPSPPVTDDGSPAEEFEL